VAPLVATCPILGVQDDHDYGLNDCWADTYKHFTAQAFADVIPGAPYPAPTYRRWSIGDLDVWMLDCRRYKDPPASQGTWENGLWMSVLRSTQRTGC
jgi:phosphodiesterase/alkaline phosphatase D-like protein